MVLASEGQMTEKINAAKGEADSIRLKAEATAKAITLIADAMQTEGSREAVALKIAQEYVPRREGEAGRIQKNIQSKKRERE